MPVKSQALQILEIGKSTVWYKLLLYFKLFYYAQGISTGCHHGAVLTNNGDWEQACTEAGRNSGDLVVRML